MPKFVFFSDLDGTLLDINTYSFEEAKPALLRIKQTGSALVFATSKTKAEALEYERALSLKEPSIIENGGAIYIPKKYFRHKVRNSVDLGGSLIVRLGANSKELEKVVDSLCKKFGFRSFHGMTLEDIMDDTGLTRKQASDAKKKEFIASFKTPETPLLEKAKGFVEERGYTLVQGLRYSAVSKGTDKGTAVKMLVSEYRKEFPDVVSVGLGDSENDFDFLRVCDKAFLVARPDGSYASGRFEKAGGIGPAGWSKAVLSVLKEA